MILSIIAIVLALAAGAAGIIALILFIGYRGRLNALQEQVSELTDNTARLAATQAQSPSPMPVPAPRPAEPRPAEPTPAEPTPAEPAPQQIAIPAAGGVPESEPEPSPEDKARQLLQQSVQHVRERQEAQRSEDGVDLVDLPGTSARTPSESGFFEIECPSCGGKIQVSNTDTSTRYVCEQCGTPVRFED